MFRIGDKIRVCNSKSFWFNETGTILEIKKLGNINYYLTTIVSDHWFYQFNIKKQHFICLK